MRKIFLLFLIPVFFLSCEESPKTDYMAKGEEITKNTFQNLSTRLKGALQEGGVQNAVQYCNIMANPLVDSLSKLHNATIRRTSFNARNPDNRPNAFEKSVLISFSNQHKSSMNPRPVLDTIDTETIAYYAPIMINNPLCLTCHGNPGETINPDDYAYIKTLYPEDQAVGYQLEDLRGMWSITFHINP